MRQKRDHPGGLNVDKDARDTDRRTRRKPEKELGLGFVCIQTMLGKLLLFQATNSCGDKGIPLSSQFGRYHRIQVKQLSIL